MDNLKYIVANNLIVLRKKNGMTQSDVAEKLNYSDKSVSKWEHADSLPDIGILYDLAAMYGVTLDYLTAESHNDKPQELQPEIIEVKMKQRKLELNNRLVIILLSITFIWLLCTVVFLYTVINKINPAYWQIFIWGVPMTCVSLLYYNRKWGRKLYRTILLSILCWSLITAICLQFLNDNLWLIYILGAPVQIIIVLGGQLSKKKTEIPEPEKKA